MMKEKDRKILEEMKTKIKALPLEERIPAVAIYRLTEDYFKQMAVEEAEEEKLDAEYKEAEAKVLKENEAIILGQRKVNEQELSGLQQFLKEGETCDVNTHNSGKPIENFWLNVLKNSSVYMSESDHEAVKYLQNIRVKEDTKSETEKTITGTFTFRENPFFSNTELTIVLSLNNDMPKTSKGTAIQWKEGKCLTKKTVEKTQKNKKTGQKRTVKKEVKCKSLFALFSDFTDNDENQESNQDEEEEQPNIYLVSDTLEQLQDIVPFSLEYFLGVVDNEDDEDDFDDDEEDDDDDDDDEDKKKSNHITYPRTSCRKEERCQACWWCRRS
jgi:nucleosome assembly protein 1-like 1